MQRPSGVWQWQMPVPVVEPMPLEPRELRFVVPLFAQEASYFAASARMASLRASSLRRTNLLQKR